MSSFEFSEISKNTFYYRTPLVADSASMQYTTYFIKMRLSWLFYLIAKMLPIHCVKSVQIRSFFWSVFSCIRTEYRKYYFTQWCNQEHGKNWAISYSFLGSNLYRSKTNFKGVCVNKFSVSNYQFKFSNRNTSVIYEICSKWTITSMKSFWCLYC